MRIFNIGDDYNIVCNSEKTRNGFRHIAVLHHNGREVCRDKVCYQNRTWEAFEFETVCEQVMEKFFDADDAGRYKTALKDGYCRR